LPLWTAARVLNWLILSLTELSREWLGLLGDSKLCVEMFESRLGGGVACASSREVILSAAAEAAREGSLGATVGVEGAGASDARGVIGVATVGSRFIGGSIAGVVLMVYCASCTMSGVAGDGVAGTSIGIGQEPITNH
jgi:hypothetical protein